MKTISLFVAMLVISIPAFSQVGIGTSNPNPASMLDVVSETAGFLPPRMTNAQMNAITYKAVAGLRVYNKTKNQYHLYNGTSWQPVLSGASGWALTGNTSLNPASNFFGTTDTSKICIRANNAKSGIIDWKNSVTRFGYLSQANNTAIHNTAFGSHVLTNNTTGEQNVGFLLTEYSLTLQC